MIFTSHDTRNHCFTPQFGCSIHFYNNVMAAMLSCKKTRIIINMKNSKTNSFLFSASKCKTKACSCSKSKIGCTDFCTCSDCENEWNVGNESDEEPSSDEE